ncbi:MAG: hypothetical protein R3F49_08815 [Planctomycetota bacterium]
MSAGAQGVNAGAWWGLALLCVVFGAVVRVQLAFEDVGFDRRDPRGMLQSDPAELHYLARQFAERPGVGGGARAGDVGAPGAAASGSSERGDLRHDRRIAWPAEVDVWRDFTVGQELLVAPLARALPDVPLHVLATLVGALTASLCALGVFGLTLELLRSRRLALLAAATFTVLPAAYRTIGFVWIREDLSLPLLAAAGWLTARAARVGTRRAGACAGAAAALAAATWHGASVGLLVLVLGVVGAVAWARPARAAVGDDSEPSLGDAAPEAPGGARSAKERSDARCVARGAVTGALVFIGVACLVPALRAKAAALSAPVALLLALALWAWGRPRRAGLRALCALGVIVGFALARRALVGDDLGHVGALLLAKLEHAGELPSDPLRLAPDVRIMWQGPFAGLALEQLLLVLGVPLVVATPWFVAVLGNGLTRFMRGARGEFGLALATLGALTLTVLTARSMAFAALLVPVAFAGAARGMTRVGSGALGRGAALALFGLQAFLFLGWASRFELGWNRPLTALEDRRARVAAVAEHVPAGVPVLTDFLNGPALLADHDRPIVLQPKWETAASRARVHRFLERLYHGTPAEFAAYMRDEVRCEWLLLDHRALVEMSAMRYAAGLRKDEDPLRTGTALQALLGPREALPSEFEVVVELPGRATRGVVPGTSGGARLLRLRGGGS